MAFYVIILSILNYYINIMNKVIHNMFYLYKAY